MPIFGTIIVIKRNGSDGSSFPLKTSSCLIGRDPNCDILIQLPSVSQEHARIDVEADGQVLMTNLSKVNPTQLNDHVVKNRIYMQHNDIFTVAERSFRWEFPNNSQYFSAMDGIVLTQTPLLGISDKGSPSTSSDLAQTNGRHSFKVSLSKSPRPMKPKPQKFPKPSVKSPGSQHLPVCSPGSAREWLAVKHQISPVHTPRHSMAGSSKKSCGSPKLETPRKSPISPKKQSPSASLDKSPAAARNSPKSKMGKSLGSPLKTEKTLKNSIGSSSLSLKRTLKKSLGSPKSPSNRTPMKPLSSPKSPLKHTPEKPLASPKSPMKHTPKKFLSYPKRSVGSPKQAVNLSPKKSPVSSPLFHSPKSKSPSNTQRKWLASSTGETPASSKAGMAAVRSPFDACRRSPRYSPLVGSLVYSEKPPPSNVRGQSTLSLKMSLESTPKTYPTRASTHSISGLPKKTRFICPEQSAVSPKNLAKQSATKRQKSPGSSLKKLASSLLKRYPIRSANNTPNDLLSKCPGIATEKAAKAASRQQLSGVQRRRHSLGSVLRGTPVLKSKRVSFGPNLSPEQFDRGLPPATPIKKGAHPPKRRPSAPDYYGSPVITLTPIKRQRRSVCPSASKKSAFLIAPASEILAGSSKKRKASASLEPFPKRQKVSVGMCPAPLTDSSKKAGRAQKTLVSPSNLPVLRRWSSLDSSRSVPENEVEEENSIKIDPPSSPDSKKSAALRTIHAAKFKRSGTAGSRKRSSTKLAEVFTAQTALGRSPKAGLDASGKFLGVSKRKSPGRSRKEASGETTGDSFIGLTANSKSPKRHLHHSPSSTSEADTSFGSYFQSPDVPNEVFVSPLSARLPRTPSMPLRRLMCSSLSPDAMMSLTVALDIDVSKLKPSCHCFGTTFYSDMKLRDRESCKCPGVHEKKPRKRSRNSAKFDYSNMWGEATPHNRSGDSSQSDYTDVVGVEQLFGTPTRPPKCDYTDVDDVKRLLRVPAGSPNSGYTDLVGIKRLLRTPPRSPLSDYTDVIGVQRLMASPQRSPAVDLTNVNGLKRLFSKGRCSPGADYSNLSGLRSLMGTPKSLPSPDLSGLERLFTSGGMSMEANYRLDCVPSAKSKYQSPFEGTLLMENVAADLSPLDYPRKTRAASSRIVKRKTGRASSRKEALESESSTAPTYEMVSSFASPRDKANCCVSTESARPTPVIQVVHSPSRKADVTKKSRTPVTTRGGSSKKLPAKAAESLVNEARATPSSQNISGIAVVRRKGRSLKRMSLSYVQPSTRSKRSDRSKFEVRFVAVPEVIASPTCVELVSRRGRKPKSPAKAAVALRSVLRSKKVDVTSSSHVKSPEISNVAVIKPRRMKQQTESRAKGPVGRPKPKAESVKQTLINREKMRTKRQIVLSPHPLLEDDVVTLQNAAGSPTSVDGKKSPAIKRSSRRKGTGCPSQNASPGNAATPKSKTRGRLARVPEEIPTRASNTATGSTLPEQKLTRKRKSKAAGTPKAKSAMAKVRATNGANMSKTAPKTPKLKVPKKSTKDPKYSDECKVLKSPEQTPVAVALRKTRKAAKQSPLPIERTTRSRARRQ